MYSTKSRRDPLKNLRLSLSLSLVCMYSLKVSSFQKNMTALHFIIEFPSAKAVIFMAASAATTATFVRSVARDFLTSELTHYASSKLAQFLSIFSSLLFQTAILRHLLHPHWLHIMYSTKSRKDPLKNLCLSLALSLICIFSLKKVSSFPKNMTSLHFKIEFPSAKAVISMAASAAATAMFVRSTARDFLPSELTHYASSKLAQFLSTFSSEATLLIDEYEGLNKNRLFYAAELYAGTIVSPSTRRYRASLLDKEKNISISLGGPDEIADKFAGIHLKWRLITKESKPRYVNNLDDYQSTMISETRYLQLTFHKKHKNKVIDEYLPYVLERSEAVKENKKSLKLYTLKNDRVHGPRIHPWQSVNLDHPAKFETLAMDDETKETIVGDLDMFLKRKELYRKVGKAWKRGYLLFGPPGTGKSSLIAAMANYLNFDVYDLELTDIRSNSELRKLLITTANRSILVVEDIDASIDLTERKKNQAPKPPPPHPMYPYQQQGPKVTLSGLLNFIDGLWSSIGDERIIIFTTNHKEKLDPALLRLGRMDVHIHMSYCTPCGFKLLAKNYLGVTEHPLVFKAEEMMASSKVTPAEVGEQLLKSEDPELALNGLIKFLESKKVEERERKEKSEESDDAAEEIEDVTNNKKLKKSKSNNGLKELMKIAKSSSPAENGRIIRKDEAANALKTLFGFLEQETRDGETSNRDSSLATLGATALQESAKANGIRG